MTSTTNVAQPKGPANDVNMMATANPSEPNRKASVKKESDSGADDEGKNGGASSSSSSNSGSGSRSSDDDDDDEEDDSEMHDEEAKGRGSVEVPLSVIQRFFSKRDVLQAFL